MSIDIFTQTMISPPPEKIQRRCWVPNVRLRWSDAPIKSSSGIPAISKLTSRLVETEGNPEIGKRVRQLAAILRRRGAGGERVGADALQYMERKYAKEIHIRADDFHLLFARKGPRDLLVMSGVVGARRFTPSITFLKPLRLLMILERKCSPGIGNACHPESRSNGVAAF